MPDGRSADDDVVFDSADRGGGLYIKLLERYNGFPVYFREETNAQD